MGLWLSASRIAAGVNVILLVWLVSIWWDTFRRHGAWHTRGLLVVGGFLLVENLVWVGLYVFHPPFYGWYEATGDTLVRAGVFSLCGLETVALLVLLGMTRK